ncbi:MAG: sulfatase [Verrucomicrobiota bacterium]
MIHRGSIPALLLLCHVSLLSSPPNILLICVDDLRPELGCYGVDYIHSPNIDLLSSEGRTFANHYVQAPTCGASRYAMLTGTYGPAGNHALFERARKINKNPGAVVPSMPAWFRQNGYETISIGKVSHHPGGLGGNDWDEENLLEMPLSWDQNLMPSGMWDHPRGAMHGLANGEKRGKASEMDVYQVFDGPDTAYPDGLITNGALEELDRLAQSDKPFFLAVGLIRPHLPFGAPARYMQPYEKVELPEILYPDKPNHRTTWHRSGEFMKYNRWGRDPNSDEGFGEEVRRHYAACVTYVDAQVGRLLNRIETLGLEEDMIVVLWGDHGWHLGEHAIWGKHSLFEESLRSPLIIRPIDSQSPGVMTEAIVESIDLYPTLCELAGLPIPDSLDGHSLVPQIEDPEVPGQSAVSYSGSQVTLRSDQYRLIIHKDGYTELYDHHSTDKETKNLAQIAPETVTQMALEIRERVPEKLPTGFFKTVNSGNGN